MENGIFQLGASPTKANRGVNSPTPACRIIENHIGVAYIEAVQIGIQQASNPYWLIFP